MDTLEVIHPTLSRYCPGHVRRTRVRASGASALSTARRMMRHRLQLREPPDDSETVIWGSLVVRSSQCSMLPGVGVRCLAAWARPDFVEPLHRLVREGERQGPQVPVQLLHGAWPDDQCGYHRLMEEPGDSNIGRLLAKIFAELLVRLQLWSVAFDLRLLIGIGSAAVSYFLQHTTKQPTAERAPRDQSKSIVLTRRDHLQLDHACVKVIQALLGDESHEVACDGTALRGRNIPAGKVA